MKKAKRKNKNIPLGDQRLDVMLRQAKTPLRSAKYQKQFLTRTIKQIKLAEKSKH